MLGEWADYTLSDGQILLIQVKGGQSYAVESESTFGFIQRLVTKRNLELEEPPIVTTEADAKARVARRQYNKEVY